MPHGVHWSSALPSRKSRNSGEWFRRQRLRLAVGERVTEQLGVWSRPKEMVLIEHIYVRVGPARPSSRRRASSSFRKSRTSRTVCGESVLKNVLLVVTRNPRASAAFDRVDALVEDAVAAHGLVVALAQSVDVHDPGEVRRRLEAVQLASSSGSPFVHR